MLKTKIKSKYYKKLWRIGAAGALITALATLLIIITENRFGFVKIGIPVRLINIIIFLTTLELLIILIWSTLSFPLKNNSKNFSVRGFAERQAINAPIQGSAADIIKLAMIEIHKEIKLKNIEAEMLLQVHDELIFEVESKKYDNLVSNVKKIMESVHLKYKDFSVPLTVDFGAGDHWGQAH